MSKKLTMCKGLPASGKSTWAKEEVRKHKNQKKRINKDDLRDMIDGGEWSNGNEKLIIQVRDMLVDKFLSAGKHVIVDDTNFHPSHEVNLRELAKKHNAHFEVKFFDVDLETCIERDLKRQRSVGERVIKRMYNQYLKAKDIKDSMEYAEQDDRLKKIYLVDLDGTCCLRNDRSPYDMSQVYYDSPNFPVTKTIYKLWSSGTHIVFFTARNECARQDSQKWVFENVFYGIKNRNIAGNEISCPEDIEMYMRADNDNRKDSVVKLEMYEKHIKPNYYVNAVFDDRDQVINMWRSIGIPAFQVAEGDF